MHTEYHRHDIELRDIATPDDARCPDDMTRGCLVVSYNVARDPNSTYTEGRHVSARLPVECLVLFEDGTLSVGELSADEREWVTAASDGRIDFAGTENGPEVSA
jgi:hypothetical protein